MKELLEKFVDKRIRLVKDDGFVVTGFIRKVEKNCILFYTDGRELILSFDRIKEVVPLRRGRHD